MTMHLPARLILVAVAISCSTLAADDKVSFRSQIAPLLRDHCLACHGAKKAEGGYRVDSFTRAVAEGDSGALAFSGKDLDSSEAYRRMASDDADERMPAESDPLPKESLALFKRWIDEGAEFDGDDPKATLAKIIPPPTHPAAPEKYAATVPVTAVGFNQDGTELFVAGYHELTVWNPADGKLLRRIGNIGQRVYAIDLSHDGALLAIACGAPGRHGEVRLLDAKTGDLKRVVALSSDVVLDAAFSPDATRIATCSADSELLVFEVATGKQQLQINSHSDWVTSVAWSSDGAKLASSSRDKTVKVFDAKTGDLSITYSGHGNPVHGVAFHPDNAQVYSAGADKKLHRWKVGDGKKAAESKFGGEAFKIAGAGEYIFVASADRTVRQFESKSQKEIRQLKGHADWAISSAFHPATKRAAAGGFDGKVIIWNTDDGKQIASFVAAPK